jgi:hypothetical protein
METLGKDYRGIDIVKPLAIIEAMAYMMKSIVDRQLHCIYDGDHWRNLHKHFAMFNVGVASESTVMCDNALNGFLSQSEYYDNNLTIDLPNAWVWPWNADKGPQRYYTQPNETGNINWHVLNKINLRKNCKPWA